MFLFPQGLCHTNIGLINFTSFFLRYRIVSAGAPWVTTTDPLHAQPCTLDRSPFLYGFDGVL